MSAVVFDFDGTLARTDITCLYFYLRRRDFRSSVAWNAWRLYILSVYGPFILSLDRFDRALCQKYFFRWYHRYSLDELKGASEEFFRDRESCVYNDIVDLLRWCKSSGLRVEIHSTNIQPFIAPVARALGVPLIALDIMPLQEGCRVRTECVRTHKIEALSNFDLKSTAIVADSRADIPILEMVGFPVIVHDHVPRWAANFRGLVINHEGSILRN